MRVLNKSNITLHYSYIVCYIYCHGLFFFEILKIFKLSDQHAISYGYIYDCVGGYIPLTTIILSFKELYMYVPFSE